ncbi:hypothetical protein ABKN59_008494 [Abortiporus biennis]
MAKPNFSSSSPSAATTSNSHRSTKHHRIPVTAHQAAFSIAPSSGLLAILATVAASTPTVDGYPISQEAQPPQFLCPFYYSDTTSEPPLASNSACGPQPLTTHYSSSSSSSTETKRRRKRSSNIPDKYVEGPDGRWRKSTTWSLYGSSYCPDSHCSDPVAETAVPVVDDQIAPTQISSVATDNQSDSNMESTLPPGWKVRSKDDHILTSIILTMSLILALLICFFMVGCIIWRKKRRAMLQEDLERRMRKKKLDDLEDSEEVIEMKRVRSQQRIWARATARWKANVRLSARRRRSHRPTSSMRDTVSIRDSQSTFDLSTISNSSTAHIRDPSSGPAVESDVASEQQCEQLTQYEAESPALEHDRSSNNAEGSISLHPPAYLGESSHTTVENCEGESSEAVGAHVVCPPPAEEDTIPYAAPVDGAHVATDDKTLLARMAALASAPPVSSNSDVLTPGTSSDSSNPVVPALDDLEDDFDIHDGAGPESTELGYSESQPSSHSTVPSYTREQSSPLIFPTPPTKGALAAPLFYEYPTSFEEDVTSMEPIEEPSAPPFESVPHAAPSAPSEEHIYTTDDAIPSAPPLIGEAVDGGNLDNVSPIDERNSERTLRSFASTLHDVNPSAPPSYIP